MSMVALNAERSKVVPTGSLEARWMVDEGEVADYIEKAKKEAKMQALMREQEAARIADEKKSAAAAAGEAARRGGTESKGDATARQKAEAERDEAVKAATAAQAEIDRLTAELAEATKGTK